MPEHSVNDTTSDVIDRFNSLEIGGCHALSVACSMHEKLVLRLFCHTPLPKTGEERISNFYELQFNRVLGGRVDTEGPFLGSIKRWSAQDNSELCSETLRMRRNLMYGESFAHFELFCHRGKLDVVARDYFLTVVGKAVSSD